MQVTTFVSILFYDIWDDKWAQTYIKYKAKKQLIQICLLTLLVAIWNLLINAIVNCSFKWPVNKTTDTIKDANLVNEVHLNMNKQQYFRGYQIGSGKSSWKKFFEQII